MWKLFAMVLVVSDSGSVATSQIATDFATRDACLAAAAQLFPKRTERDENGHHIVIRSATDCRLDGSDTLPPPLPPPETRLIPPTPYVAPRAIPGPYYLNR